MASDTARAAAVASEYVARVVKESHNALIDELVEDRKFEDGTDGVTHRFEPKRRRDDPPTP